MARTKHDKKSQDNLNVKEILAGGKPQEIRTVFRFDRRDDIDLIVLKFNLFTRYFFIKYFESDDAQFHSEIDINNAKVYVGENRDFLNVCFRGAAKTTRTKLFIAFCVLNDYNHYRKFIKILCRDTKNSTQFVTDIYNMLVQPRVKALYPEIFEKTTTKREETMHSFTTSTGVKILSGTVGSSQRGQIQDESRPDFIIFDDFEDRLSLRSAVTTQMIFDNMEEARTGLSKDGSVIYLANYLSERGNVHKLMSKVSNKLVVPIISKGKPSWSRYSVKDIKIIEANADDFAGEYMCEPSAGPDIMFDRSVLDKQEAKTPVREIAGFKIFHEYDASHRYGSGHDVAGGVGLDSSTSVFIDFTTFPSRVVATYKSNTIKPDTFGHEIRNQADRFGRPVVAVENNKFDMCIGVLKGIYDNLFFQEQKEKKAGLESRSKTYGWNTNSDTKPKMIFALKKAVEDGHLELSDPDLIAELRSYTRDDLMDKDEDVRLTTRHFDLLIACAIAYQMKDHAEIMESEANYYEQPEYERSGLDG